MIRIKLYFKIYHNIYSNNYNCITRFLLRYYSTSEQHNFNHYLDQIDLWKRPPFSNITSTENIAVYYLDLEN